MFTGIYEIIRAHVSSWVSCWVFSSGCLLFYTLMSGPYMIMKYECAAVLLYNLESKPPSESKPTPSKVSPPSQCITFKSKPLGLLSRLYSTVRTGRRLTPCPLGCKDIRGMHAFLNLYTYQELALPSSYKQNKLFLANKSNCQI